MYVPILVPAFKVPIGASFTSGPVSKASSSSAGLSGSNEMEEDLLRDESPVMILGIYRYPVAHATVINTQASKICYIKSFCDISL